MCILSAECGRIGKRAYAGLKSGAAYPYIKKWPAVNRSFLIFILDIIHGAYNAEAPCEFQHFVFIPEYQAF